MANTAPAPELLGQIINEYTPNWSVEKGGVKMMQGGNGSEHTFSNSLEGFAGSFLKDILQTLSSFVVQPDTRGTSSLLGEWSLD